MSGVQIPAGAISGASIGGTPAAGISVGATKVWPTAAVTFDAVGQGDTLSSTGTGNSLTWTHTATAGSYVLCTIAAKDTYTTAGIASVTYGGVGMTPLLSSASDITTAGSSIFSTYYLQTPLTGPRSVVVGFSGAYGGYVANSVSYLGVSSVTATHGGPSGNATYPLSPTSGQATLLALYSNQNPAPSGGNLRYNAGVSAFTGSVDLALVDSFNPTTVTATQVYGYQVVTLS